MCRNRRYCIGMGTIGGHSFHSKSTDRDCRPHSDLLSQSHWEKCQMNRIRRIGWMILVLIFPLRALAQQSNVVLFVADGLRAAAVSPETAPTMARVRAQGVDFRNSHSLFPTV